MLNFERASSTQISTANVAAAAQKIEAMARPTGVVASPRTRVAAAAALSVKRKIGFPDSNNTAARSAKIALDGSNSYIPALETNHSGMVQMAGFAVAIGNCEKKLRGLPPKRHSTPTPVSAGRGERVLALH